LTKPKKVQTAQQQMRELRAELRQLNLLYADALDEKHEYQRRLLEAQQDLARAKDIQDKLSIQLGRRDGYIDRVREIEKWQMEYHAKEQEARLGIKPSLPLSQIDLLREHLANSPEDEAKKILDVISEDLKNRVTGFDPAEPRTEQLYSHKITDPEVRYSSDPKLRDWMNGS
jgi:hypothetical protein